jgi:hypothetical protein
METHKAEPHSESKAASAPPPKPSATRLAVLLGILAVVLGALAYDQFAAKPKCEAADKALEEFVQETNAKPVNDGGIVGREQVQKHFGWGPTWVVDNEPEGYTIEYYCWWGYMPYLSRQRHFIAVLYKGKSRRYAAHYRAEPEKGDLPSTTVLKESPPAAEAAGDKKENGEKDKTQPAPAKDTDKSPADGKTPATEADKAAAPADKSETNK